jgi:uncharacterized membrane protein YkoI
MTPAHDPTKFKMQNDPKQLMSTKRLFPAILLLLLSFASVAPAPAKGDQAVTATDPVHDGKSNPEDGHLTIDRELELFRSAEVSLRQAMAIAEKLRTGARIVDISLDGEPASPVYRVTTLESHQIWEDTINANTGKIQGTGTVSSLKDLGVEDRNNLAALNAIRQELLDAVLVAERSTSGKAISAGLMSEGGKLNFIVTVLCGDDLKEVVLEPPQGRRQRSASRRPQ